MLPVPSGFQATGAETEAPAASPNGMPHKEPEIVRAGFISLKTRRAELHPALRVWGWGYGSPKRMVR